MTEHTVENGKDNGNEGGRMEGDKEQSSFSLPFFSSLSPSLPLALFISLPPFPAISLSLQQSILNINNADT